MPVLNVLEHDLTDHCCYILKSTVANKIYVGYTVNFKRRLRKHNGEIKGGAKRTQRFRPWVPVCVIKGFYDSSSALRFEWKLQHCGPRRKARECSVYNILTRLKNVIHRGDGSIKRDNIMPWPKLYIEWKENYDLIHPNVFNCTL